MYTLEPTFVVKVCGITCQDDLTVAIAAGANAVGFNFYLKSPRYLDAETAGRLVTPEGCLRVGVFVNATRDQLEKAIQMARLGVIQLHGKVESVPDNVRVWRSISAGTDTPTPDEQIEAYLLDAPTPQYGGSGRTFDWSLARNVPFRVIVAGGLDGDNVASAIETLRPWGVDACSRLECAPGRKDAARVQAFVTNALRASERVLRQEVSL